MAIASLVRGAIKRGDLIRQPCEICGKPNTDAHHNDYSKPLEVRWLCRSHHRRLHHEQAVNKLAAWECAS